MKPTNAGSIPTPEQFRRRFPVFDNKIFINSCSKGALSDRVSGAYEDYLRSWREQGSQWDEWMEKVERVRSLAADFFGCSTREMAVSFSASSAAAGVASALDFQSSRRKVLLGDFEFATMAQIWRAQQRRGAEIVPIRAEGGRLPAASYETRIDEQTLVVPIAHVCFRNGFRQDIQRIVAAAKDAGAYTVVDDYQSSGTFPVDVKALGCDFFVSGALKYLLGSSGLGFLYVREELVDRLQPLLTGWFGQEEPFAFDIDRASYHATARRFETGTLPIPSVYAGAAGLEVVSTVGPSAVAAHVETLASVLIDKAGERGWSLLSSAAPEERGPMVAIECRDAERAVAVLGEQGIVVSSRGSALRVSFHYYNIMQDVDALVDVLDRNSELVVSVE